MKTILIIFFALFIILYTINSEERYFYEIKSIKNDCGYMNNYYFIYKLHNNQKVIIDSILVFEMNYNNKIYIHDDCIYIFNYFYTGYKIKDSTHIGISKDTIRNDTIVSLKGFEYLIGLKKYCDCIFDSTIATITCDSSIYKVDLLEMKLK